MAVAVPMRQQALMSPVEISAVIGIEVKTLANWRSQRVGPKSIKVGRLVRYRMSDIEKWLITREQENGAG